jgi:hypothetical protein
MQYLNKVKTKMDEFGVIYTGCKQSEIDNLIQLTGKPLPLCYKEYLLVMGKDMDRKKTGDRGFLVGTSAFLEDLESNNGADGLKGLLEDDNSQLIVHDKAFVFYGHQGYLYCFFKTDEGDNPPVYGYAEGFEGSDFPKISNKLSQFYEDYLDGKNIFDVLR